MLKNKKSVQLFSAFPLCIILLYFAISSVLISICKVDAAAAAASFDGDEEAWDTKVGPFVPRDQRRSLVSTEYGEISAAKVTDGINGSYYLQFIKLEPNALFLPVILHADMIFYVQTGSGRVGFINEHGGEENGKKKGDKAGTQGVDIQRGDVYRLPPGTVFFIQSSLEPERQKLRICAIFANSEQDLREPVIGAYSSIRDIVLGFDKKVLQAAFQVPEEVVEEMTSSKKPLAIVHGVPKSSRTLWEVEAQFVEALFGRKNYNMLFDVNKKKGKSRVYNIPTGDRDVENCNGWSSTVTSKQLRSLRGSNIGIFMVNLTKGAMMGPHWNPMATEIAIVLEGQGMVHVVCPSTASETECKNKRIRAQEGDVFVVPRFHPMAQMSFNNGSFVFVGFTTTNRNNHPQFLAGKSSVLQTLDKQVLAESFNASNSTIGQLLAPQSESIILECVSCAEEEERLLEEEIEKEKEEARKKEEEEARKREEEKRKHEEEEARKREEEKKKKEEEEARKREEEEKKRKEQEEARKREEEEKKRKEEEAKKKEEEEEARKREDEEKKRKEQEEARKREDEEKKRKEQEEERKSKERQQQEDDKRRKAAIREEATARQQEEEMEKQQQEEEMEKQQRKEEGGPDRQKEKEREKQQQEGGGGGEEKEREKQQQEGGAGGGEEKEREKEQQEGGGGGEEKEREKQQQEGEGRGTQGQEGMEAEQKEEEAQREEEMRRQAAARKKKEEEAQQEERGRKAAAREEEAARQQEEERGRGQHKQQKEKEREKQQQEGRAGSRGQETEVGQQEAQFWPGDPEKRE